MATRHQVRESIVGLLYAMDIGNSEIQSFLDDILEEKKIRNRQKKFALALFEGVRENLDKIDEALNEHLKEWDLKSLGNIERSILRLGAYEMLFSKTDNAVVINEAIELAKTLCSETSPKFINGVLDALRKSEK
ncbi:MAG: transcription antitermination factor NusB [Sulfurospirillaceae bacterium]|nr:transcription antitermination factor NusB [Sulfurospirillaceae bacterium]MCK9546249.1 transcription antitermination factor NusB [Sulfurospirillaceae bacterium]MDY0238173.1 transcription antitermination factor NusB [Campylobacterales bacterium]NLM99310.1 transcription antitermination factor NusB [Campylobacteraceae bacterium]